MSEKFFKVEVRLESSNFTLWELKLSSLMTLRDIEDSMFEDPVEEPVKGATAEQLAVYDEWKKRSLKLRSIIELNVDEINSQRIRGIVHGREALNALRTYHKRNNIGNVQRLQQKLASLMLKRGESMKDHLDKLFELYGRLKETEANYGDDVFVNQILTSIRGEYKSLCDTVSIQTDFKMDPWQLRQWLIDYAETDDDPVAKWCASPAAQKVMKTPS
jgi:hypothetical protein